MTRQISADTPASRDEGAGRLDGHSISSKALTSAAYLDSAEAFAGHEINAAALAHSLDVVKRTTREQLEGQGFGKALSREDCLYGFTPYTCTLREPLRVKLDASYTQTGNGVIAEMDAAPALKPFQDRIVLVVHQMRRNLQEATIDYLKERLPGIPAVALISPTFRIDTQPYLDYFRDRSHGGGFAYSNGGRVDFRDAAGVSFYRPLEFNFSRLDVAGGYVELCQRNALMDAIRIAIDNANRAGKAADLHVNFLAALSYKASDSGGGLETLSVDLRSSQSSNAINTSLFTAKRALPDEFRAAIPHEWRRGPPYRFESAAGNRVTFTFEQP